MKTATPNYDDWTIGRFFDHLCGKVVIDGTDQKYYWLGMLLAARGNLEEAIKILYAFLEAGVLLNIRPIVETLISRIYAELGEAQ